MLHEYDLEKQYYATATYDEGFRKVNDAALYLLSRSYASTRLENSTLLAASHGVDYSWPLWDQRLIQQWLSTPAIWKVGNGGISRYLHRTAVAGVGPDHVIWNSASKDMGSMPSLEIAAKEPSSVVLRRINELAETLPVDKQVILDLAKVRRMATTGNREDWHGEVANYTLKQHLEQLEFMYSWQDQ